MKDRVLLASYLDDVSGWDRDRIREQQRSMRLLSVSAALGWVTAIVGGVAVAALTPLKTVEPFVVRVDNTTGVIDVVPQYEGGVPISEAVTRYLLSHYVQVCERFNFSTAESDYEECAALNGPQRNAAWAASWARSNPKSPLNVYRDGTTVRAQVKAVTFFERGNGITDLAQVRYLTAKRVAGGTEDQIEHWVATLQYAYVEPPGDPRVRRWNPLGFRVIEFRAEPEVEAAPVTAAPAATVAQSAVAAGGVP
jgi:type IV secretion system protein VirB8